MSRYSDLPPGCSPSDIPGNRPEDVAAEEVYQVLAAAWAFGFTEEDIIAIWREVCKDEEDKAEQHEEDRRGQ